MNRRIIKENCNSMEINKILKDFEGKVKRLRIEMIEAGDTLLDLEAGLEFVEECQFDTHPVDCVKTKNLWSKLLEKSDLE